MSNEIGKNILNLRKQKGITQEVLSRELNISTQAVSKWENGGVPDVEMLPLIADFFDVSIDYLYKGEKAKNDIATVLSNYFLNVKDNEIIREAYKTCWYLENAMFRENTITSFEIAMTKPRHNCYSQIIIDQGMTFMGLSDGLPYFAIFPDSENDDELFEDIDYVSFFYALGDKDVFNTLIFLVKNGTCNISHHYLKKQLGISEEKAEEILDKLEELKLVVKSEVDMGTGAVNIYTPVRNPNIKPFLIFAKAMIKIPNSFYGCLNSRNKTMLR